MIRRPPRSTRTDTLFPTRRSSDLRSLLPASLLGIAAGSALGPEAPLVQTGGVLGTEVAHWRGLDLAQTRVLAICGMASAFAVLFGAPLGSAIFALELLHRRGPEYYEELPIGSAPCKERVCQHE